MVNWGEHMAFGGFWMILFWIVVIVAVIWLVKIAMDRSSRDRTNSSPIEILKRRYAAGEISKEEFEERKREILDS